jgi:hypothetical protein
MLAVIALAAATIPPAPTSTVRYDGLPVFDGVCTMIDRAGRSFRLGLNVSGSRHEDRSVTLTPIDAFVYLPDLVTLGPQYERQTAVVSEGGVSSAGRFFIGARQISGTYLIFSGTETQAELQLRQPLEPISLAVGICTRSPINELPQP